MGKQGKTKFVRSMTLKVFSSIAKAFLQRNNCNVLWLARLEIKTIEVSSELFTLKDACGNIA